MSDEKGARVSKSDEEWRHCLTPEQYQVLRRHGTEHAFTGEYHDSKEAGTYKCAGCGAPLFASSTKFDSGTGWPSFWEPIDAAAVGTKTDRSFFMTPDRGAVRGLRRASRARLRRRPRAHRAPILHQLGGAQAGSEGGARQEVSRADGVTARGGEHVVADQPLPELGSRGRWSTPIDRRPARGGAGRGANAPA